MKRYALLVLFSLLLTACGKTPVVSQADVIVVGAGIAGIAAAIEAADNGAKVIVVDANSVGGGHAVKAGGLAMVDTALQRKKGIHDSPKQAIADLLAWGEDADPEWVKRYAHDSGTEVYDWLVKLGVKFKLVLPTPESEIPRFHFTKGTAVHVVLPMLHEALSREDIQFLWNTGADALLTHEGRIIGIHVENLRTGTSFELYGNNVVLATGGFQSNTDMVLKNWNTQRIQSPGLLIGSGQYATGDGYQLAVDAGAKLLRMDHQVTFVNGIQDPRDASGTGGLTVTNKNAILINDTGQRFVDESLPSKAIEQAVFAQETRAFWTIFDAKGARKLGVRGAQWLTTDSVKLEIINNPKLTQHAATPAALAAAIGVPADTLELSINEYNATARKPISEPPFYALQLHPLTRKSMGGPAINENAQVLTSSGSIIPGLYAAGELTGVAGINGSFGGSGTFLGPSVYIGRIAGKSAAASGYFPEDPNIDVQTTEALALDVDGYWHYNVSHDVVHAEALDCDTCHNKTPMAEISSNKHMRARLSTCLNCH